MKIDEQKFADTVGVEVASLTDECKALLKQYFKVCYQDFT